MNNLYNCPVCGAALVPQPEQLSEIKKHYWYHKLEELANKLGSKKEQK